MFIEKIKYYTGKYWYIVVLAVFVAIFVLNASKKDVLPAYNSDTGRSEYTVPEQKEENVKTFTYSSDRLPVKMEIPMGWEKITKDGYDTFVHSPSASSIQIQILSYYPSVNNVTDASLSESFGNLGYEVTEFEFTSDSSYYVLYKKSSSSGITDYIENVYWDRFNVVKTIAVFNEANYSKLKNQIWHCVDSFSWTKANPITNDCMLVYDQPGDFEFAVPSAWISSGWAEDESGASYYAYDESSGASLTVNVLPDSSPINDINEIDYGNFLSNGRQKFILNVFQKNENIIYGEATYSSNQEQYGIMQNYYANGVLHYIVTYEFPMSQSDNLYGFLKSALSMTRFFGETVAQEKNTADDHDDPENVSEEKQDEEVVGEITPFELPETKAEEKTSSIATFSAISSGNENVSGLNTGNMNQTSSDEQADSFAGAIQTIIPLSVQAAEAISKTWDSLGLGTPAYAEGYMEDDTYYVVMVTTDMQVNYYLYIEKSTGLLNTIHVNTADGPVV